MVVCVISCGRQFVQAYSNSFCGVIGHCKLIAMRISERIDVLTLASTLAILSEKDYLLICCIKHFASLPGRIF